MNEKQNQKKKVMILVLVLGLVLLTIGGTYAFFTYTRQGEKLNTLMTGTMYFVYDELPNQEGNQISIRNAFPMTDDKGMKQEQPGMFEFEVRAKTQGAAINYEVYLTKGANNTELEELPEKIIKTYLTSVSNEEETPINNKWTKNNVNNYDKLWISQEEPVKEEGNGKTLLQDTVPDSPEEYQKTFRYRMWIDEEANEVDENGAWLYNNQVFSVYVNVYASNEKLPPPIEPPVDLSKVPLMKTWTYVKTSGCCIGDSPYYTIVSPSEDFHEYYEQITNITFSNKLEEPEGTINKWDVSEAGDGRVMAYMLNDPENPDNYKVIIAGDGGVYANPKHDMTNDGEEYLGLLRGFSNLKKMDVTYLNVSQLTDMSYMFGNSGSFGVDDCFNGTEIIGLENWNVSKVTNMSNMFYECNKLENLNLSGWNASNVTDMSEMFRECSQLTTLDLSGWDISSVTDMSWMFYSCSQLSAIIGLEGFITSSVENMDSMFLGCSQLTDLSSISGWDTSSVTIMSFMFYRCSKLSTLDLSNWNTSSVTNMSNMFSLCSQLTDLNLSNWHTSSVTNMSYMFDDCSQLTDLSSISNWDTSQVTNMSYMFNNCSNLKSVGNLSDWDTSSVTSMDRMFYNCSQLTSVGDLSGWDTSSVTNMIQMFYNCSQLTDLDLSGWDTSSVTSMGNMFWGCSQLKSLDLSGLDTSSVTSMYSMFYNCSQLIDIYVKDEHTKQWFIDNAESMNLSNPNEVVKVKGA